MKFFVRKRPFKSFVGAFSLVETAIVLALIGIILSGLWGVISQGYMNTKVELSAEELNILVNNIRAYYSSGTGVPAVVSTHAERLALHAAHAIPGEMDDSSASYCPLGGNVCLDTPWGIQHPGPNNWSNGNGTVDICGWKLGDLASNMNGCDMVTGSFPNFAIVFIVPSQIACTDLVIRMLAPTAPSKLVDIIINTTSLASKGPIKNASVSIISTLCNPTVGIGNAFYNQGFLIFVYAMSASM